MINKLSVVSQEIADENVLLIDHSLFLSEQGFSWFAFHVSLNGVLLDMIRRSNMLRAIKKEEEQATMKTSSEQEILKLRACRKYRKRQLS